MMRMPRSGGFQEMEGGLDDGDLRGDPVGEVEFGGGLDRERAGGVLEMEEEGFRPGGDEVGGDGAANDAILGGAAFDGAAGIDGDVGAGGGEEVFGPERLGAFDFVDVDAAGVVVLVECEGEVEVSAGEEADLGADLRDAGVVERAVEVAPRGVETGIVYEPPRVEAREDEEVKFFRGSGVAFDPGDEALGGGRFVAVDAGGEIDRGLSVRSGSGFEDMECIAATLRVGLHAKACVAGNFPPPADEKLVVVRARVEH